MNLRFGELFADAAQQWRSERELLLIVAAVFLFLPALGFGLLLGEPSPLPKDAPPDAAWNFMALYVKQNWQWILGAMLFQEFGTLAITLLLIEPGRPTVGQVLSRAARLFPGYLLIGLIVWAAITVGAMLFIVPGLYAMGRLFVVGPTYAADPARGPIGATESGLRLSRRHGWILAGIWLLILMTAQLVVMLVPDPAARNATSVVMMAMDMILRMAVAAIGAAASIAVTLLRVAAYRRLTAARQGI